MASGSLSGASPGAARVITLTCETRGLWARVGLARHAMSVPLILSFQPHVFPCLKLSTSLQNLRFSKKPKAVEGRALLLSAQHGSLCPLRFSCLTPTHRGAAPSRHPHRFPYRKREADRPRFLCPSHRSRQSSRPVRIQYKWATLVYCLRGLIVFS